MTITGQGDNPIDIIDIDLYKALTGERDITDYFERDCRFITVVVDKLYIGVFFPAV